MRKFTLKILWLEHNIAFAIDHVSGEEHSPLSAYFFWPRNDAWTQAKSELESKPWISENDKIDILNEITAIINYWQDSSKKPYVDAMQEICPELIFYASQ